ncbi:hypothetical protein [Micromonospora sp. DT227]|uniref:hypothetical protein n=1 Tax=Micromonospora sp. DT227 TaxID=3393433 RepID=UPI003CEBFBBC
MTSSGNTETVVIIRPPARDQFGDPTPGETARFAVAGCLFAPGPSVENLTGANQVTADGTIYAPPATDVRANDQVLVRGDLYEVDGKPQDWGTSGVVIVLRLVTG